MLNILPFMILFNLAFSIWELTCESVFPSSLFTNLKFSFVDLGTTWNRALQINFYTVMFVIAIAYVILDYTVVAFFKSICVCECVRGNVVVPIGA